MAVGVAVKPIGLLFLMPFGKDPFLGELVEILVHLPKEIAGKGLHPFGPLGAAGLTGRAGFSLEHLSVLNLKSILIEMYYQQRIFRRINKSNNSLKKISTT